MFKVYILLITRVTIEHLHQEANLQSIERRCQFHLLKLLYDYNLVHVKPVQRCTCAASKIVFDISNRCSEKYLNGPLYKKVYKKVKTRLHNALVFKTYKPNNEKAKANVFYRGAMLWNTLGANYRNMDLEEFKLYQKQQLAYFYLGN